MNMSKIIVIGGGASGMIAAIMAARNGHDVSLYEKNDKLGKKIYIKWWLKWVEVWSL